VLSLTEAQANFINTINNGPDALDPDLFAGPIDRVVLGLKAHANTISHARLVALEETFPLTRRDMGEAMFNALSRDYAETAVARATDSNTIGDAFAAFLRRCDISAQHCELAEIEWRWLESYHAADAAALTPKDLAGLDEASLLDLPVASHSSLRLVPITHPLAAQLDGLAGLMPAAIATIRPEAEVRLVPLDALELALATRATQNNCNIGNLIQLGFEQADERAPLEPILNLIGAGALVKAG
jgi:hypothetical protein